MRFFYQCDCLFFCKINPLAFHLLISFIRNFVKNDVKYFFNIFIWKRICAIFYSYFLLMYMISFIFSNENRKTKLMKCYTVRYIKISIPKCYLSDFPKTRISPLKSLGNTSFLIIHHVSLKYDNSPYHLGKHNFWRSISPKIEGINNIISV